MPRIAKSGVKAAKAKRGAAKKMIKKLKLRRGARKSAGAGRRTPRAAAAAVRPVDAAFAITDLAHKSLNQDLLDQVVSKTTEALDSMTKGLAQAGGVAPDVVLTNFDTASKPVANGLLSRSRSLQNLCEKKKTKIADLKKVMEQTLPNLRDRKDKIRGMAGMIKTVVSSLTELEFAEDLSVLSEALEKLAADRSEEHKAVLDKAIAFVEENVATMQAAMEKEASEAEMMETCASNVKKIASAAAAIAESRITIQKEVVTMLGSCSFLAMNTLEAEAKDSVKASLGEVAAILSSEVDSAVAECEKAQVAKDAETAKVEQVKTDVAEKKAQLKSISAERKTLNAQGKEASKSLKRARDESSSKDVQSEVKNSDFLTKALEVVDSLKEEGMPTERGNARKIRVLEKLSSHVEVPENYRVTICKVASERTEEETAAVESVRAALAAKQETAAALSKEKSDAAAAVVAGAQEKINAHKEAMSAQAERIEKSSEEISAAEEQLTEAQAALAIAERDFARAKDAVEAARAQHKVLTEF